LKPREHLLPGPQTPFSSCKESWHRVNVVFLRSAISLLADFEIVEEPADVGEEKVADLGFVLVWRPDVSAYGNVDSESNLHFLAAIEGVNLS
jgi:hypothetical protein